MESVVHAYRRNGFAVVRGVFPPAEIEALRGRAEASADGDVRERGELLRYPGLRDIVLDPRVLNIARAVLGPEVVYFGDSTFYAADRFSRHLHVDARNDVDSLDAEYPILRMGIYLQDHDRCSDGLKVGIGSHRRALWRPNNVKRLFGRGKGAPLPLRAFVPPLLHNVETRAGDVVFWNLRTHHSGHAVRLRIAPRLALHPKLEDVIPRSLTLPAGQRRFALFMSFAAPSNALEQYLAHMSWNPHRRRLREESAGFRDPTMVALARERGLTIRNDWATRS